MLDYLVCIIVLIIPLSFGYITLDIGLTYDDWVIREVVNYTSNGGWHNGDIVIENSTTGSMYHGPFDDYTVSNTYSILSRQIRVANFGYIRVNFTLIFGCDVLNFTDDVDLHFDQDTNAKEYYWIDTYSYDYITNHYPYTTPDGFTIDEYYDPLLLDQSFCTNNINAIGDQISWVIYDSYLSPKAYNPGDTFLFALTGRFNHLYPYDDDGKFWAVTDIVFELIHIETDQPTMDPTSDPSMMPTQIPTEQTINPTTAIPTTWIPTMNPTYTPSISPIIAPTTNPSIVPTYNPTDNPTLNPLRGITTTREIMMESTDNVGIEEEEEKKEANYSVLIILIVIFVAMCIAMFIIQRKKKKTSMERATMKHGNVEMGDPKKTKSDTVEITNDDDGGLLNNDVIAMRKTTQNEEDELISNETNTEL